MSFIKKTNVILGCLSLASCGFQPLYGPAFEEKTAELDQVKIVTISDRQGQILRNELLDIINPWGEPGKPLYRLKVMLDTETMDAAFRRDATPQRRISTIEANIELYDVTLKKIIYNNKAETTTSYDIADITSASDSSAFSAIVSEKKGIERAMKLLAQEIKLQISTFLATKKSEENPFKESFNLNKP